MRDMILLDTKSHICKTLRVVAGKAVQRSIMTFPGEGNPATLRWEAPSLQGNPGCRALPPAAWLAQGIVVPTRRRRQALMKNGFE